MIDIESVHLFSRSNIGSDFGDDKDLNEIKTDYGDDKDLNQVETNYGDNKDNIDIETNLEDNENNVEIQTNYGDDENIIFLKVAALCNSPLPDSRSTNISDPSNETRSIAEFDMMQSSPSTNPMSVGPNLLTSASNCECESI